MGFIGGGFNNGFVGVNNVGFNRGFGFRNRGVFIGAGFNPAFDIDPCTGTSLGLTY